MPPDPPPKSLEAIFAIEDPDDFFFALLYRAQDAEDVKGRHGLTNAERKLIAVFLFWADARNGGFNQYFLNSSGDYAGDVAPALSEIGATATLSVFQRAVALMFTGRAPDPTAGGRWEQAEAWTEAQIRALLSLDFELFTLKEDVEALLAAWARTHRGEFT